MYSRSLYLAPPLSNAEMIHEVTLFAIEKHNEAKVSVLGLDLI